MAILGLCIGGGVVCMVLLWTLAETLWWWQLWNSRVMTGRCFRGNWNHAMVFLTGISDYAAPDLAPEQIKFLEHLGQHLQVDEMIAAPFPYETATSQAFSCWEIWRRWGWLAPPLWVMALHNFWQTLGILCCEKTYGRAVARCIINRLGLPNSSDGILWLICGSTGAGMALAAAPWLQSQLSVNLVVIAYGGVFRATSGLNYVEKFYDLIGENDSWAKLGRVLSLGHYWFSGAGARAKKERRWIEQSSGLHQHLDYLSDRPVEDSTFTYQDLTLQAILKLPIFQNKSIKK